VRRGDARFGAFFGFGRSDGDRLLRLVGLEDALLACLFGIAEQLRPSCDVGPRVALGECAAAAAHFFAHRFEPVIGRRRELRVGQPGAREHVFTRHARGEIGLERAESLDVERRFDSLCCPHGRGGYGNDARRSPVLEATNMTDCQEGGGGPSPG